MATVLVVDDEPDIRELVRINLELDGHEVISAHDGPAGLKAVQEAPPDVIVLDVMMPGMDGWEVLSWLKSQADLRVSSIPVLMLTARTEDLDRIRGGIEGAIRYITKPFSMQELRDEIVLSLEGEPEPARRRKVQRTSLEQLARVEKGEGLGEASAAARPKLTRLEHLPDDQPPPPRPPPVAATDMEKLSDKQCELLEVVASTPTVREAAEQLSVSRSNVYASLRRIARKLGVRSVPELVNLARQGALRDVPR
ncbi:MAG: two-component system, OmpR family, operon response regulator KdpE [Actinomycetota bacterium]|jgi:DNA-binding NarL/FixJ family response regulator|nr:two-component system, OmpR family, operon response regulator KdpE [Actinomycetota bacterium]